MKPNANNVQTPSKNDQGAENEDEETSEKNEKNDVLITTCIIIIFLLSNIPRVILNCSEILMIDDIIR